MEQATAASRRWSTTVTDAHPAPVARPGVHRRRRKFLLTRLEEGLVWTDLLRSSTRRPVCEVFDAVKPGDQSKEPG